jgi:CheY-like chemotaxis protein
MGQFSGERRQNHKVILVVEDDRDIGEVLVEAITHESPYQVMLATDGLDALRMVEGIKPGLFVLDYQLPGMNGIELYDRLRAIEALADVPALMMSARLPCHELEKRKIVGMNKPIDLDEFLQTLDQLLA